MEQRNQNIQMFRPEVGDLETKFSIICSLDYLFKGELFLKLLPWANQINPL